MFISRLSAGCLRVSRRGTADAEIKISFAENPELPKLLSLKPEGGQNIKLCMLRPLPGILPSFRLPGSFDFVLS